MSRVRAGSSEVIRKANFISIPCAQCSHTVRSSPIVPLETLKTFSAMLAEAPHVRIKANFVGNKQQ